MQFLNIFHVLIAIALVAFVLIQRGQGATAGAAFGSGASGTVFGSRGAGTFLTRTTWVLAALFCAISLTMAVVVSRTVTVPEDNLGVLGNTQTAPAVDEVPEETGISVSAEEPRDTDLPSFDNTGISVGDGDAMNEGVDATGDDLPSLDDGNAEAVENEAEENTAADEQSSGG